MGAVLLKTLFMFILSFVIAMFVALLIYWIRQLLTSVRLNSLFDEKSKGMVKRAQRIHKIHDKSIREISDAMEEKVHPELFDFYKGVNEEFRAPEDYYGVPKPVVRKGRPARKNEKL